MASADLLCSAFVQVGSGVTSFTVDWNETTDRSVLGTTINCATHVGTTNVTLVSDANQTPITFSATFQSILSPGANPALALEVDGSVDGSLAQLIAGEMLVGTGIVSNLSHQLGLPDNVIITFEESVTLNAGTGVSDTNFYFNVFAPEVTETGEGVAVTSTPVFVNPATGEEESAEIILIFDDISTEGETTVLASASSAAQFSFGFEQFPNPVFFDIDTTAIFSGSIEVCIPYADVDNDGFVDGTSTPENDLVLLHEENGVFVDRTSSLDTTNNILCANVASFSDFTLAVDGDDDDDGVSNAADFCEIVSPITVVENSTVNAKGCTIDQQCPCAAPALGDRWRKPSSFRKCIKEVARVMRDDLFIDKLEERATKKEAKVNGSTCGS